MYSYKGILLRDKEEGTNVAHNRDELKTHYVNPKKTDTKESTLSDYIYMTFWDSKTHL